METKRIDLQFEQKAGSQYCPMDLYSYFETIDSNLLEIDEILKDVGLEDNGYKSQLPRMQGIAEGLGAMNAYSSDIAFYSKELLDNVLFKAFNKGATEALSRIHSEDYTTENTLGIMEHYSGFYPDGMTYEGDTVKASLNLEDFMGLSLAANGGNLANVPEDFVAFTDLYAESYDQIKDQLDDVSLTDYLKSYAASGEYSHEMDQPVRQFFSTLADITIVVPIIEACTGYDLITHEDLSDFERGMKAVGAIIDIVTFGQGMVIEKIGGATAKELLKFTAKNIVIDTISCGVSYGVGEACNELELPMPVTLVLSLAAGVATSKGLSNIIFKPKVSVEAEAETIVETLGDEAGAERKLLEKEIDDTVREAENMDLKFGEGSKTAEGGLDIVSDEAEAIKKATVDYKSTLNEANAKEFNEPLRNTESSKYTEFKYKHNPSDSPKVLQDAIEDSKAVYGYKPNDTGSLKKFVKYDWSDPEIVAKFRENRLQYHIENDSYRDLVKSMREHGNTDAEIAKTLVENRNANRLSSYVDENGRIVDIELYNQAKEHCVSYEQLRQGHNGKIGKTDLEIIESAMRGNEGMDACCGLYDDYYYTYK